MAKALKQNTFTLTGRFGIMPLSTQGVALGYELLPFQGVQLYF